MEASSCHPLPSPSPRGRGLGGGGTLQHLCQGCKLGLAHLQPIGLGLIVKPFGVQQAMTHQQRQFIKKFHTPRLGLGRGLIERNHDIDIGAISEGDDIGRGLFTKKTLMGFANIGVRCEQKRNLTLAEI